MLKIEVYELIKVNHLQHRKFVVDEVLQNHGYSINQIPPYHPEPSPIELIWAELKNWVGTHNISFNKEDFIRLTKAKIQQLGQ